MTYEKRLKAKVQIIEDKIIIAHDLKSTMEIVRKSRMDGIEAAENIRCRWGLPVVFLMACEI